MRVRSAAGEAEDTVLWDVALPERSSSVPGIRMAGFRDRGLVGVDLRMVPHPAVMLALEFGSGSSFVDDTAGRRRHGGSFVAGLGTGCRGEVRVRGENFAGVQVRLSPVIARAVLGVSPADLDSVVVTLDDLWGREATRVREQLDAVSTWEDRFAVTDALLTRRQAAALPVEPEVAWAWQRLVVTRGRVRIEGLAAELGWSRKRLWSRFHSQLGLPPKRAANLVRFDHAVHRLAAGADPARVAAESGYADQSHLHREVVALTGSTPATVVGEPWLAVDDLAWTGPRRAAPAARRPR